MEQQLEKNSADNLTAATITPQALRLECPHCDKKYFSSSASLTFGQARFQCSSCDAFFAINWFGEEAYEASGRPQLKSILLEKPKKTKSCYHCAHECDDEARECPACGVIFAKEKPRSQQMPQGMDDAELNRLWQGVVSSYADEKKHRDFIQRSLEKDQLVFASHHYRVILAANSTEPTAVKMQKLIMSMAEMKQQVHKKPSAESTKLKFNFYKIFIILCMCSIAMGALLESYRPLVALGSSVLFFSIIVHYWISSSEI